MSAVRHDELWRAGPDATTGAPSLTREGTPVSTPPAREAIARESMSTPPAGDSVIWHELECGGYAADFVFWEELADESSGAVLDLGCGTGRVALRLAQRGHGVVGLDRDAELIGALSKGVGEKSVEGVVGDARGFDLDRTFGVVLAPMQLLQLFGGEDERVACLRCVAAHLAPGGIAACAIVEAMPLPVDAAPPLPDTREVDGWVYSSLPVAAEQRDGEIRVRRLRQVVSPAGELSDELDEVRLAALDAATLEREAALAGLHPCGRRSIPPTADHVGSTVVLLRGSEP